MDTLKITTSTNVELEYQVAGLGDRILAWIIDFLILFAYYILMNFVLYRGWFEDLEDLTILSIVFVIPLFVYHLLFEIFNEGQSPGKMARKIRVGKVDGSEPGIGDYVLRWLLRIIDITITFGAGALIAIISTRYSQRLGDLVSGCTVIRLKPQTFFEETIFRVQNEDYEVQYLQAEDLDQEEVYLINEVLSQWDSEKPLNPRLGEMIRKLSSRVQNRLNIQKEGNDLTFLRDLMNDYNHLTAMSEDD